MLKIWVLAKQQADIELQTYRRQFQEQLDQYKQDLITLEMESKNFQQQLENSNELFEQCYAENKELSGKFAELTSMLSVKNAQLVSTESLLSEQEQKTEKAIFQLTSANEQVEVYKIKINELTSSIHHEKELKATLYEQLKENASKLETVQHNLGELTEELRFTKLLLQKESNDRTAIENKLALRNEQRRVITQEESLHHLEQTINNNISTIESLRKTELEHSQAVEQIVYLNEKLNIKNNENNDLNEALISSRKTIEQLSLTQRTIEIENITLNSRVGTLVEQNEILMNRLTVKAGVKK
jgi:chromosome segregation ATPase